MYLKKLEVLGFKSFAEKTILHFEPGITAIVGPNGAGKSNIFDAVRWVLGEQSVKSMRGSKMEDVIFNGTDLRPPVGFAEVNLTFLNENRLLAVEQEEVTVTRRLYRSGESEYFINKAPVRLKDIVELFMGTGIGAESYSLIEQGKMDLILSSRSEDRRLIFDEASGITKYKSQKKEALSKLEDTEQNLIRINDIIIEVKRQIGSLERQATKARRYKEIFDELKRLEVKLANFQASKINKQIDLLADRFAQTSTILNSEQKEFSALESSLVNKEDNLHSAESNINQIKDSSVSLENSIKNDTRYAEITKERTKEVILRLENLEKLKNEIISHFNDDEAAVFQHKTQLEHTHDLFSLLKEEIQKKELLLKDNLEVIKATEKNIIQEKATILELTTGLSKFRNLTTEINVQTQNLSIRRKRLELEKEKTGQEKLNIEGQYNELNLSLNQLKSRLDALNLDKQKRQDEFCELNSELSFLTKSCQDLENQKLKLESQREFIEKLKSEYEGLPQKLNAIILVQDLPEGLSGILARINNSESLNLGLKQNFENFKHILRCDAKPIPLETETISKRIEEIVDLVDKTKILILEKQDLIEKAQVDIKGINSDIQAQEIEIANFSTKLESVGSQLNKLKQEDEVINFEIQDLNSELDNLNTKNTNVKLRMMQDEESLAGANKLISDYQVILEEKLSSKEGLIVSIAQDKTEFQGLEGKLSSQREALEALELTFNNNKLTLERYSQEENDCNSKLNEFNRLINELDVKIKDNLVKKEKIESEFLILKEKFIQLQEDFKCLKAKKEEAALKIEGLKNDIHKIQIDQKTFEFQKINLIEKIQQLYKENIETQAKETEELDEVFELQEINNLKAKLTRYEGASISTIEEFDELKKRYDFLLSQQDDLIKAKSSVQEAIAKINRTTRKLFLDSFEKIAEEFKNYFRFLFQGGEARVFLSDENNPLDCGIEIICRPPGKKLQNILLLSGGEKALSATALMFAIFKVKPSPFCVLDEIDASLDEANIDRFSGVLQEFAKDSQFIVITHNKRTMTNANVMYGITMQEQGISKIVSVKLTQNQPKDTLEKIGTHPIF